MYARKWEVRPYCCPTGFASVVLTWDGQRWGFGVSGNSGATGFGWRVPIHAPAGSDLKIVLSCVMAGTMPPEILADRLEDESSGHATVAAWLRHPELRAVTKY